MLDLNPFYHHYNYKNAIKQNGNKRDYEISNLDFSIPSTNPTVQPTIANKLISKEIKVLIYSP